MLRKIWSYIEKYDLISRGDLVIAGVSGGPDSMALLHILKALSQTQGFAVAAAHLNHSLREEADTEEELVRNKCQLWDIPFYARTVSVKELARNQKISLEDAGRVARYQFFNELAEQLGANRIATAHHSNDVAETVLLHLLRGSGIKGLRGILPIHGNLIRPLLEMNKTDLIGYVEERQIEYSLDSSNADPIYLRNRIRHQLLPYLEQDFNPRIIENLNQLALIARDENQVIEDICTAWWDKLILEIRQDYMVVDNKTLINLPLAYQRRLIIRILSALAGETGWALGDVQRIIELSHKKGSSLVLHLKKKVKVNKSYDKMIFTTCLVESAKFNYKVSIPGLVYILETGDIYSFELRSGIDYNPAEGDIYLDYDNIRQPLYLRSRRNGDVFYPNGLGGSKKIKDYFIDLKIPSMERDRIALLASENNEIYAVLGLRISSLAALNSNSSSILVIKKQ